MKKNFYYIIGLFLCTGVLGSCGKWLDTVPSSQVRNENQFNTEEGFQQVLLGCYIGMVQPELFGCNLSFLYPDLMAQQYNNEGLNYSSTSAEYQINHYLFKGQKAQASIDDIWLKSYNVIANANNALANIESRKNVLHPISHDVIHGELLAIRAYMHFVLMRLFGHPNLARRTDKETLFAIPYVVNVSKDMVNQLSYAKTFGLMINDLKQAIELLKKDPIIKSNDPSLITKINVDGFFDKRSQRINYYTAKAILAQVYMWEGSQSSLTAAQTLLAELITESEADNLFPFVSDGFDSNLALAQEHLFGLNVIKIKDYTSEYFSYTPLGTSYLAQFTTKTKAEDMFRVPTYGSADNRFSKLLYSYTNSSLITPDVCISRKYEQATGMQPKNADLVPVLRMSEVYLMKAECVARLSGDIASAKALIEKVSYHRGVHVTLLCNDLDSFLKELTAEYAREFLSEGELFYLYKRLGVPVIKRWPNTDENMTEVKYTFPYPEFELQSGRVQSLKNE